jgi:hypothetical protein
LSLANTFHDLPESAVRRMCGENAIDVYGLDPAPAETIAAIIGAAITELTTAPDLSQVPDGYVGFGFRTLGAYS